LILLQLLETEYHDLIKAFRSVDPSCRPTTVEALNSIQEYHVGFTPSQLKGPVPEPELQTMTRMREATARQVAREKRRLDEELVKTSAASS
jgi:hypothetical protein